MCLPLTPENKLKDCRGSEGIDFDANLQISTLDFGTIHVRLDVMEEYLISHWIRSTVLSCKLVLTWRAFYELTKSHCRMVGVQLPTQLLGVMDGFETTLPLWFKPTNP